MLSTIIIGMTASKLIWTEWLMVVVFVIGVVGWGFRMRKSAGTLEGSFLADRKVPGFIASLSTVATNLNANDFIGAAGFTYGIGVVLAHGSWVNGLALIFVSLFLVRKFRRLNVFTLGGWLEQRYCPAVGSMYSIIWSMVWMLFNLGLYLYAGALVLNTLVGWDIDASICLLSVIAASYTLLGGFGAVVATDVLQVALMFFPFIFLAASVWMDVGSVRAMVESLPAEKAVYWASETPFGHLSIMLWGSFLLGISYWTCEAQVIQRPLASRSEEDATVCYLGTTFWLMLLFPILVSIPALAAIKYFPDLENPDLAMPMLIRKYLPRGLYGVTVVGLVAGVFSSADSQINAFCTMFTHDIYKRLLAPDKSLRHYLTVSKIAGIIFTLAAIGTALVFKWKSTVGGMFLFAISILATIMPPFGAITVLGALNKRINKHGALAGVITGGLIAIGQLIVELVVKTLTKASPGQHAICEWLFERMPKETLSIRTVNTFLVTALVAIVVSLLTKAPPAAEPQSVSAESPPRLSWRVYWMVAILLVGMVGMIGFWTYYF